MKFIFNMSTHISFKWRCPAEKIFPPHAAQTATRQTSSRVRQTSHTTAKQTAVHCESYLHIQLPAHAGGRDAQLFGHLRGFLQGFADNQIAHDLLRRNAVAQQFLGALEGAVVLYGFHRRSFSLLPIFLFGIPPQDIRPPFLFSRNDNALRSG